ncbi:MAG: GNAT family N-acetyltransferase [Clostridia bacterium]|nr:GNAT family N-acetyltransferase [Clostridia bacterium]
MRLIPVDKENMDFYKTFENSEDLSLHMSRIYPNLESSYLKWMYIEENGRYIGSIWLEGKDIHLVRLGIFIADPAYRDKGIGKKAIQKMIAMAEIDGIRVITLNVRVENARAVKVYTACGFKIKKRFKKENGIEAFSMELEL